jgi:hypothetical protein
MGVKQKNYYVFECDSPFCWNTLDIEQTYGLLVLRPWGLPWGDVRRAGWSATARNLDPNAMPHIFCPECTQAYRDGSAIRHGHTDAEDADTDTEKPNDFEN